MNLRHAPTQVLPIIEVDTPTGTLTSYPFGAFDLADSDQRNKFGLFDALSARVRAWKVQLEITYADSDLGISLAQSGTCYPRPSIQSVGASEIVIPGWTNPHSAAQWPALYAADLAKYVLDHGDYAEEVFAMPDVRTVTGADDLTPVTTQDGYTMQALANMVFNKTDEGPDIGDGDHVMLHTFSYRTRTKGYLALIFVGDFFIPTISADQVIAFASQDHFAGSDLINPARECGTLTINWPNPYITGNPMLTLTCPIFGTPDAAAAPSVTFTVNATVSPSECFAYGGIYNNDGTTNVCPLN